LLLYGLVPALPKSRLIGTMSRRNFEVAEKRRAEQTRLSECTKKADEAKVLRRDRAVFVGQPDK
jgi:hypothetical protein